MHEMRTREFKENISNSFLKMFSALANYDGEEIHFGIDDNGVIIGLSNIRKACLDSENKINDSIIPQPDYIMDVQSNDRTIKLIVKGGSHKPYLYKSKATKRNDTATIEADTLEFSRLVLAGKNIRFEELQCEDQELTFDILSQKLKVCIQLATLN